MSRPSEPTERTPPLNAHHVMNWRHDGQPPKRDRISVREGCVLNLSIPRSLSFIIHPVRLMAIRSCLFPVDT